jgi:hypothetical protein
VPLTGTPLDRFEAAMPRLHAIAHRMLGSADDTVDAVQDTFLRRQAADSDAIEVAEARLTTVLTDLCRTHLSSARVRREASMGRWLPEPLLADDSMLVPAETAERSESPSYGRCVAGKGDRRRCGGTTGGRAAARGGPPPSDGGPSDGRGRRRTGGPADRRTGGGSAHPRRTRG